MEKAKLKLIYQEGQSRRTYWIADASKCPEGTIIKEKEAQIYNGIKLVPARISKKDAYIIPDMESAWDIQEHYWREDGDPNFKNSDIAYLD